MITLKLEDNETVIYIDNEKFIQCKGVVLSRTIDELKYFNFEENIDDLAEKEIVEHSKNFNILGETEFWVHCSNLQVWVEHNYNTQLLHSNLAFPLLKKLSDLGEVNAIMILKEEVLKRLSEGNISTITFLINEGFHKLFEREELFLGILDIMEFEVLKEIEEYSKNKFEFVAYIYEQYDDLESHRVTIRGRHIESMDLCWDLPTREFLSNSISKLKKLKTLKISGFYLYEIPEPIFKLEWLNELYIYSDNLKLLSNKIRNLKSLKKLYLFNNTDNKLLSDIPDEIGCLTSLEILSIEGVSITKLPESIKKLKNLKSLYLNLKIREKPNFIAQLTSIEILHLSLNGNLIGFNLTNLENLKEVVFKCKEMPLKVIEELLLNGFNIIKKKRDYILLRKINEENLRNP